MDGYRNHLCRFESGRLHKHAPDPRMGRDVANVDGVGSNPPVVPIGFLQRPLGGRAAHNRDDEGSILSAATTHADVAQR